MEVLQQAVINYCKLTVKKPDPCATITDLYEQISASQLSSSLLRTNASPEEQLQVTHWVRFSLLHLRQHPESLAAALAHATYLVSDSLSLADLAVWAQLSCCPRWLAAKKSGTAPAATERHFNLLSAQVGAAVGTLKPPPQEAPAAAATPGLRFEEGGKFRDLAGAVHGQVVVRFPPEASGYLHVGHAKAALLNQHYRDSCGGRLVMRFDDTNPAKETAEFEQVILEDVAALGVTYDHFSHTSDHFERMLQLCERLLREGRAYVDDTEPEAMKAEREKRVESRSRGNSVEQNMRLWEEMKAGTKLGCRCCVRAKIDMASDNGCMRDPTIYRCKNEPHLRTGNKYKVYPTYDFACPIVDSLEGVTHALRTLEYRDRDAQYNWFIDALGLRKPLLEEFSRLNLQNTVLSKRKLTWFVNEGLVDGWDDPRFPTVRGILRRGMTLEGLRQFILAQGFAKSNATMEWDKLWAFNKKVIDPVAPRYTALLKRDAVPVLVTNFDRPEPYSTQVALHPKNADVGTKTQWHWRHLLIDGADAETLHEGELVTFMNWGNLCVVGIQRAGDGHVTSVEAELRLDNTDYRKTQKVTWLAQLERQDHRLVPAVCVHYEHIISKPVLAKEDDFRNFVNRHSKRQELMLGDAGLAELRRGDIIQLQRRGFFICDEPAGRSGHSDVDMPCYLLSVPDGHQKEMPKAGSRHKEATTAGAKAGGGGGSSKGGAAAVAKATAGPAVTASSSAAADGGLDLLRQVQLQGDKVRDVKAAKAGKDAVQAEVAKLLQLKADFKARTGLDWKPELLQKAEAAATAASSAAAPASTQPPQGTGLHQFRPLLEKIGVLGDLVRDLKAKKADQATVKAALEQLLALKAEFKAKSGQDWKPELLQKAEVAATAASSAAAPAAAQPPQSTGLHQFRPLLEKIGVQGDLVRDLKAKKADQATVKAALEQLLALKAEFKAKSGLDHKPDLLKQLDQQPQQQAPAAAAVTPAAAASAGSDAAAVHLSLLAQIQSQGNRVRDVKAAKVDKDAVQAEVAKLLQLKAEFKARTGLDWKPELLQKAEAAATAASSAAAPASAQPPQGTGLHQFRPLLEKIGVQGDLVRDLKAKKADQATVKVALEQLLALKADFKAKSGLDHKPDLLKQLDQQQSPQQPLPQQPQQQSPGLEQLRQIKAAGDRVRALKEQGPAGKSELQPALDQLTQAKAQFKQATGTDYKPDMLKRLA